MTAEGNRYTYTGREWDEELSLYHYRARMYDSVSGRFLSRDPIGFWGGSEVLYGYVDGSPVVFVDPSGLRFWSDYWYFLSGGSAPADPAWLNNGSEIGFGVAGVAAGGAVIVTATGIGAGAPFTVGGVATFVGTEVVDTAAETAVSTATGGAIPFLPLSPFDLVQDSAKCLCRGGGKKILGGIGNQTPKPTSTVFSGHGGIDIDELGGNFTPITFVPNGTTVHP